MNRLLIPIIVLSSVALLLVVLTVAIVKNNNSRKSVLYIPKQEQVSSIPDHIKKSYNPVSLTIDSLFSSDHEWVATLSAERVRTLLTTGDVLTARMVNDTSVEKNDFQWAFRKTADLLRESDSTFINLETPLVEHCPRTITGMTFCGDVRHVDGLVFAGIDVVNLANNHMGNWGQAGVDTTNKVLHDAGLLTVGMGNPAITDIDGLRFAFLGYNDIGRQTGVSHVDDGLFEEEIRSAARQADIVVVAFHWGVEYTYQPTVRQRELAYRAIDAGADLIIGNHPHWIQPVELYKNKLILYAHGNFIFDQMWSDETRQGFIGKHIFYDDQLIDVEFIPLIIEEYGQPGMASSDEKELLLNILHRESVRLLSR